MIVSHPQINEPLASLVIGHIAQRAHISAFLIAQDGIVRAINTRSVALMGLNPDDVLHKAFVDLWAETERSGMVTALSEALSGNHAQLGAEFIACTEPGTMDVEILPVEWSAKTVTHALALVTKPAEGPDDAQALLVEAQHSISNLATVMQSTARMLAKYKDDERLQMLARGLIEAADQRPKS